MHGPRPYNEDMSTPPGLVHLSDEDLAAYVDRTLDLAGRARVDSHLIECDDCRVVVTEAMATLSERQSRRRRVPIIVGGLAAAAGILLVVSPREPDSIIVDRQVRSSVTSSSTEDVRRIVALAPESGSVLPRESIVFAWRPEAGGTVYQLTVSDAGGAVLWSERTSDTTLALPPASTALLRPGQIHYWRVEALLPDLRTAMTPVRSFFVSGQ